MISPEEKVGNEKVWETLAKPKSVQGLGQIGLLKHVVRHLPSQLSQQELLDMEGLNDDEAKARVLQKLQPIFGDRYKVPPPEPKAEGEKGPDLKKRAA